MNQSAYQYSLYLLSRQDYSEHKLRQKLKFKQFETQEIDETI
jgi:SOS response regulatory protein OraA/RecX